MTVERSVEAMAISAEPDGTRTTLRGPDGREEEVVADWLVGCDGAHSIVRRSLGATFDGETNESDWMLGNVHMTGYPVPDKEASVYWHRDGAFIIFPITPGRYRVIADLPPSGEAAPPTPTLDKVQAIIDRRGPGNLKAFDPIWLAGFRINGRKVSKYRWGRVFLAGDAAHIHSPGWRPGHEHRHAGRLQSGLEARVGRPRDVRRGVARQLQPRAQLCRRSSVKDCRRSHDRRYSAQPRRANAPRHGRSSDTRAHHLSARLRW